MYQKIQIVLLILFYSISSRSDILIFPHHEQQNLNLSSELLKFVSDTLHLSKPAMHLECDVKVREMNEERKFSDGVRRIETLEVIYKTKYHNDPERKMYFPVGSKTSRKRIVSEFSGTVEEIILESADRTNSRFIFQHNGRGEIIWMSFENDLTTSPCLLTRAVR